MRLPLLFRRPKGAVVGQDTQEQAEKLLADSLRTLSQLCLKVADFVEAQRLNRQGFDPQGKFLQRLDRRSSADKAR